MRERAIECVFMAIVCYRSNTHSLWKKMKVEIHWRIYFIFFPVTWIITIGQCRILSLSRSPLRFFPCCAHSVDITFSLSFLIFLLIWQWFCFFIFHKIRNIARALNGFYSTSDLIYCMFTEKRQVLSLKERKKVTKNASLVLLAWALCWLWGNFSHVSTTYRHFYASISIFYMKFFQRQFQLQTQNSSNEREFVNF